MDSSARSPLSSRGFTAKLQRSFERDVVLRGEQYASRVRVMTGDGSRVAAKVAGTILYSVVLAKEGSTLKAWCTCPYCEVELSPCKHIWATLRAAELRGMLGAAPKPESLALDPDLPVTRGRLPSLAGRSALPAQPEEDEPESDSDEDDSGADDEGAWDDEGVTDDEADALHETDFTSSASGLLRAIRDAAPLPATNPLVASFTGPDAVSWKEVFAASRLRREWSLREQPERTELHYLVLPAELRQANTRVHLVEIDREKSSAERLAFVPARERARQLGRDAFGVEYWLAGQRDRYGSPRLAAELPFEIFPDVLRELADTGRLHVGERRPAGGGGWFDAAVEPVRWDGGAPWKLALELARHRKHGATPRAEHHLGGFLTREAERRPLGDALVLTAAGLVIFGDVAARFDPAGMFGLVSALRVRSPIVVGEDELEAFVRDYYLAPSPPPLTLPDGALLEEAVFALRPVLDLGRPVPGSTGMAASVWFQYDEWRAAAAAPGDRILDWTKRCLLVRDLAAERLRLAELVELGFRGPPLRKDPTENDGSSPVTLSAKRLPAAVRGLLERGWRVEAEGKPYRVAGTFKARIESGIDWFELDASLDFGTAAARLPALLRALKKGDRSVVLDDGSVGLLPEEWLARWGVLGEIAGATGEKLRFLRSELPLLAAMVENAPEIDYDAAFARLAGELTEPGPPEPCDPPAGFIGELRAYQREGLGWLGWLERMGLGGCLADDMGLGKTVQILALLAQKRDGHQPSLIVAPRSVVANWAKEAARFVPELRVHTHWGPQRSSAAQGFDGYDLVLTTYGTLCRDIDSLAKLPFRFVVLDEAQAVKNAGSRTARSVRMLSAQHRLALTGTPIENHLGELFSLFEFLNPGMLGRAKRLQRALTKPRLLDAPQAQLLARAVRPFILRRTKNQVARDLPERTEQTLYVELSAQEREKYDELLAYYRASLAKTVENVGLEQSAPHVLAALLRLRQAACHIGLLDEKRIGDGSAKLEVLLAQLEQVLEGGHKALVFSQFTSLLAIVRTALDERKIAYEYLDGKTRDREARIDRFQGDAKCGVFLVSLKAGGVGLNLTAADYVFILDPWWNPAVEAQAIDRAHRIGQTRRVVAYRLLARGTVEEKVEELQRRKRDLVRAVLGDDAGFGGKLSRDDLELLMS